MPETLREMFSYGFMLRALLCGTLVALCLALLGVSLVLKRYSMIGDGLSHVGFGAVSVGLVLGIAPLAVAVPVVMLAAFLLLRISSSSSINGDAAIALISSSALAAGLIVTSLSSGMNADVNGYLFGSILADAGVPELSRGGALLGGSCGLLLCRRTGAFVSLFPPGGGERRDGESCRLCRFFRGGSGLPPDLLNFLLRPFLSLARPVKMV